MPKRQVKIARVLIALPGPGGDPLGARFHSSLVVELHGTWLHLPLSALCPLVGGDARDVESKFDTYGYVTFKL